MYQQTVKFISKSRWADALIVLGLVAVFVVLNLLCSVAATYMNNSLFTYVPFIVAGVAIWWLYANRINEYDYKLAGRQITFYKRTSSRKASEMARITLGTETKLFPEGEILPKGCKKALLPSCKGRFVLQNGEMSVLFAPNESMLARINFLLEHPELEEYPTEE